MMAIISRLNSFIFFWLNEFFRGSQFPGAGWDGAKSLEDIASGYFLGLSAGNSGDEGRERVRCRIWGRVQSVLQCSRHVSAWKSQEGVAQELVKESREDIGTGVPAPALYLQDNFDRPSRSAASMV
jgi:hypothetical protein